MAERYKKLLSELSTLHHCGEYFALIGMHVLQTLLKCAICCAYTNYSTESQLAITFHVGSTLPLTRLTRPEQTPYLHQGQHESTNAPTSFRTYCINDATPEPSIHIAHPIGIAYVGTRYARILSSALGRKTSTTAVTHPRFRL
jgi:hypothetical protein